LSQLDGFRYQTFKNIIIGNDYPVIRQNTQNEIFKKKYFEA